MFCWNLIWGFVKLCNVWREWCGYMMYVLWQLNIFRFIDPLMKTNRTYVKDFTYAIKIYCSFPCIY